jgi:hypothetical protein
MSSSDPGAAIAALERLRWLLVAGTALLALPSLAALPSARGWFALVVPLLLGALALALLQARVGHWRARQRAQAPLPVPRFDLRVVSDPGLDAAQCKRVEQGLRQYLHALARGGARRRVAQPSVAVDWLWRSQQTRPAAWRQWLATALGFEPDYLAPRPPQPDEPEHNDALRRAWYWACRQESIDPRRPQRVPLLFALDDELRVPGGIVYQAAPAAAADGRRARTEPSPGSDGGMIYFGSEFGDVDCVHAWPGDAAGFGGCESGGSSSSDGDGGGDGGGGD